MPVTAYTLGGGNYGSLNGDTFVKINGVFLSEGAALFSLAFRAGHSDSLKKLNGTVMRGGAVTGNLRNMWGDSSYSTTVALAPDATKLRYQVSVPLPAPPYPVRGNFDRPFSLSIPTTSIPIGRFYAGAGDPNTNQWAGLTVAGIQVLDHHGFDNETAVRMDTRVIYASPPPTWSITYPSTLTEGQTEGTEIRMRIAYPDNDPVVGLAITFRGSNYLNLQDAEGRWVHEVTAFTDSNGELEVRTQAINGGGGVIEYRCSDSRSDPAYFNPPLSGVLAINTETATVGGVTCVVVPPVPAVPSIPTTRVDVPIRAWDAGANSIDRLDDDVELSFTMGPAIGVVIGITPDQDPENVSDYARMTHAFSFGVDGVGARVARIMESGRAMEVVATNYVPTDLFSIYRAAGQVTYALNGDVVYTSRVPSTGELAAGSSLYATGDTIPGDE